MTDHKHRWEPLLYSSLGVAAMFLILVALGVIASFGKVRLDLTEDRLYTLSDGTRKILRRLMPPLPSTFIAPGIRTRCRCN